MNLCAIVIGIAPCLEADLQSLWMEFPGVLFDYMAIGLDSSDRFTLDIQHVATYHPGELLQFKLRRSLIGGNLSYETHAQENGVNPETREKIIVDHIWPLVDKSPYSGSSAFLGTQACVGMGYQKIVLCGCPLEGKNMIDPKASGYNAFQKGWQKYAPEMFEDKVRSMSGWTKEFLGAPTKEWLRGIK